MAELNSKESILEYNRMAWNTQVKNGCRWTVPVTSEDIQRARQGDWEIVLTPEKPVPRDWFPDFSAGTTRVLCLASGGGQQGPILAAAGAQVTIADYSESQLEQDKKVAKRDGLELRTVKADMADLSMLEEQSFDLIFHPCSNCFVQDILPVWKEAFRVLKPQGRLLAGFTNPLRYLFDEQEIEKGNLRVAHSIPYSDLKSISEKTRQTYIDDKEPLCFGHTLSDQIAGQIQAGFSITGMYEDNYGAGAPLTRYIDTFVATQASKAI